jgi:hypothetical protein
MFHAKRRQTPARTMSELTTSPIGMYPEDRARLERIKGRTDLKNAAAVVRFCLKEVDERQEAAEKRQKSAAPAPVVAPGPAVVGDEARLDAAIGTFRERLGRNTISYNEIDRAAEVARGTTRNVLNGGSKLETAGGGRLLEWVEREEAAKAGAR